MWHINIYNLNIKYFLFSPTNLKNVIKTYFENELLVAILVFDVIV